MANSLEEEDVVRVNGPYRLLDPLVERKQAGVLDISRLVERVVARDPGVVLVVLNVSEISQVERARETLDGLEKGTDQRFSRKGGERVGDEENKSLPPRGAPR